MGNLALGWQVLEEVMREDNVLLRLRAIEKKLCEGAAYKCRTCETEVRRRLPDSLPCVSARRELSVTVIMRGRICRRANLNLPKDIVGGQRPPSFLCSMSLFDSTATLVWCGHIQSNTVQLD